MGKLIDSIRKEKKERAEQEKKQKATSLTPQLPSYSNVLAKQNDKYGLSAARKETSFDTQPTEKLSLIEQIKREKTAANAGNIIDRLNTWYKNSNNFMSNYQTRFSGLKGTYDDPYDSGISDWLSTVTEQKSRFDAEADSILSYLTTNRDLFDEEWLNATVTNLDFARKNQDSILKNTEAYNTFWSQFADENEYLGYQNEYQKQKRIEGYQSKYEGKGYEDIVSALGSMDDSEEKDWLTYESLMRYDLNAGQEEIGRLTSILDVKNQIAAIKQEESILKLAIAKGDRNAAEKLAKNNQRLEALNSTWEHALSTYGSEDNLNSLLSSKRATYTQAERAQKAAELASVADPNSANYDPSFTENSQYQSTKFTPENVLDKFFHTTQYDLGYDDLTHEYINGDEAFRAEVRDKYRTYSSDNPYGDDESPFEKAGYDKMTEQQIATYNYYYNTAGKEKAQEYLDSLEETLKYQVGVDIAKSKEGKLALQYIFAVEAGIDQFEQGVGAWFTGDDYIVPSATQYASGIVREDLAETGKKLPDWLGGASLGQLGYDAINTTANMLPSILVSTVANAALPGVGTIAGAGLLGASAGGNARAEMLNLGYSKEQATSYGLMVGIAEAGMEYLLGHIPGLSKGDGLFSTLGSKVASKVDNAISRVAIALGDKGTDILKAAAGKAIGAVGGALDEALEEGLQTIIEPWLKEAATSVDWDDPKVDEILYSSLLGAITSFGFSAGETVIDGVSYPARQNAQAKENLGAYQGEIASEVVALDPKNSFAKNMQAKVESGQELSGAQLNRLVKNYESSMTQKDIATMQKAAENKLTERGERGDVKKLAEIIVKAETGKKLTRAEESTLNASDFGRSVRAEMSKASLNSDQEMDRWAEDIGTDRINAEEYNRKPLAPSRVSIGGKTAATVAVKDTNGNTIKAEIQSVEADGEKATFTLSNGETVASDKVAFKTEDAKLVADIATERVSRVEGFTNEAATAMIKGYDGNVSAVEYAEAFSDAFELGANNEPSSKLVKAMNSGLSERVAHTAYVLGKESTKNVESVLKTDSKNGIINTNNESEAGYESGESLYLRDSGEWAGGQNTEGQVPRMEGGSGQAESRGETRHVADGEAARLVNEGREVKVADLGILGGSNVHTVRLVDQANETTTMKKAREAAEARGLKVKFFVGDNLTIKDKNGKWFAARAFIKGEYVFIRADHPSYTADQLMRHELGHDKIAKGEVDINAVRERLIETVGKENIDFTAKIYADAYIGSGMSAEEIWEECICDSLGDMNVFNGKEARTFMAEMLPEINKAINETKSPTQTRGSPEGKASRDNLTDEQYYNFGWVRANDVISSGYWKNFTSNYAEAVNNKNFDRITPNGEYMIEVYDANLNEGAQIIDHIVFAKGDIGNPEITRIIEIDSKNETKLSDERGYIYALERNGIRAEADDLLKIHTSANARSASQRERIGGSDARNSSRLNAKRSRSEINANPITRTQVNEDENTVTITYKNGETVTEKFSSPEEAKASGKVGDAKFSIEFADDIANKQRQFAADGLSRISSEELEKAIADTAHMVNEMKPYANILPQDKVGKTLVKNGSYDVSVENTTVCIRTLAYNSFVDMVSEKVGRPLTQMESFLVSQKLYDIAKEPQCLYCYVSLDRKAFNEMVIRYTEQRDAAIAAYEAAGKPKLPSSFNAEWTLFKEFLTGRKPTKNMWDRYVGWINAYNKGDRLVSLSDISTEAKRLELVEGGGETASQVKDILKYAQSASWAKKQTQYVAYYDEILKLKPAVIRNLNNHYGMRWYSFSDYSGAFIVENMQQITDAAIRGLKGLSYTKDTDFAEIFAPTGMNINISVYAKKTAEGGYEIDAKQSANIEEAIKLREQYPNVGIVVVATDKAGVEWALAQEWSDVVIPFHTVRTGADVAEFYNWEIFNAEQNDTVSDQNLWDAYTRDVGKKKASKMVYPSEHQNNRETYLSICEKRGLTPRFKSFLENPNYMKLVNETRQSEGETSPLKANYNLEAAERSFDKFVEKGGYYEGWYNDGIDVDGEADIVAEDVRAGKRANEVGYGRQDVNFEDVAKGRRVNREHGKASRELDTEYLSAVNRGDMETAQKMVDEAAKKAGYTIKAYHGSNADFTVFDKARVGKGNDQYGAGFYFASNADVTELYGKKRYDTYLNIKKPVRLVSRPGDHGNPLYNARITQAQAYQILKRHPLMYDKENSPLGDFYDEYWSGGAKEWMVRDLAKKYDTIGALDGDVVLYRDYPNELHEAIRDVTGYDGVVVYFETENMVDERNDYYYVAWFDNQMKSADPVVRDDNGDVIPLTERFDPENNDIRYSRELDDLSIDDFLLEALWEDDNWDDLGLFGGDSSIEDVSETLDIAPERIEILFYREGLGDSYIDDGRKAVMTQARIDEAIEYNGASNPAYARRLITRISPKDFIDLTVLRENQNRAIFDAKVQGDHGNTMDGYDYEKALKDSHSNPYLVIDLPTGQVIGHNGRHRMRAMELLGIQSVEIEVELYDEGVVKYHDGIIKDLKISSQFDTKMQTILSNIIPLNESYRKDIENTYGEKHHPGARVKYSRELDFLDFMEQQTDREVLANAFESVAQNDVEKAKLKDYRENIDRLNTEEEKLMKLRAEIKELSFAKGARDISKIAALRQEAEKTANRIGIYDKRLLTLEASKPLRAVLEREKQKSYNRAKAEARADLDAYRERALMKQEELKTRYQESKKRGVEGRKKTEVRHKIQGVVGELNTLLLNPTAKKHIKEELRRGVAEALSAFNMDTIGAEERLAEINRKLQNESDPYEIARLLESYNRIKNQDANLKEKLEKLNTAYEKIKDSDDIELNLAYQEIIQNSIKAVSEKVGDTSIRDMTLEELELVYDLFKMIRHTIRDANKAFKAKKALTITQMSEAANQEIRTVAGQPYQRNVVSATAQRMGWSLLKPYVAFRTIGSDVFTDLYRELRNGEDTFYADVTEAQTFIEDQYDKHGFKNWDMKATKTFKSKSGKEFELTLEQMMTLYAYSKREQAHAHIMEGGIVFEDALVVKKNKLGVPIKYEVTTKDAFNLSVETFTEIASSLTEEQKAFVDAMQAYLSEDMGAKGNEISMQLLGVKLFKEKFYLPIKSSRYYMNFKAEEAGEVKLRNPAFSKETVHHANNPIVLHNFTDLWAEHINDMSMYHAFVLALEDFTRVYNYKTRTDANVETMDTKATLETAYPGVTNYINKFLKDMNGGVRVETVGWAEKLTSLSKKGAVLGSASVAVQQPSAIMRAMAYINPKYFVGEKVSEGKHKEKWVELKKYAPIAGIKEMGRFDVGMGQSTPDWIKAEKNILEKGEDFLSLLPAFMDEVTWLSIWNAVKRETAHNYPKLATSSEAFLTLAGERFTDVISLSQVYDSVFSRSDIMRNKSWIAKSLTAFMAEPTTTLNMLWDACVQGKRTGSKKGFVATTTATGGAVMAAIVFNTFLKSFVMAMRDDDEDESYIEKYLEHFASDLKDDLNPLNLIPFVKDIWSIYKGYDVERMDMMLFSDLKDAIAAFDSDNKTLYEKWSGLIGAVSALFGVPFKNVERDVRALFNTIFGEREETTLEGMIYAIEKGWTGDEKSNGQQLYEAMLKGDAKHIERVKARFEDQDAVDSAVYKALRDNDERITAAAEARYNGDIAGYMSIAKEIIAEGIFSQDTVVSAINSKMNALKKAEKTEDSEDLTSDKAESIYRVEDFYKAIRGNDIATAYIVREDIINVAIDNGKSKKAAESAFESSVASFVGDRYKSGLVGDKEAADMLTNYAGMTEDEASSRIRYWAFVAENPEYKDLSESAVNKYYDGYYKTEDEEEVLYCKSAQSFGITLDIYAEYVREKSGLTKKEDIMYIINILPLTKEQKDALYYLNGWAKSTIREAPWR